MSRSLRARPYAAAASLLLLLFLFRVVAQLAQRLGDVAWLPPFESWHSATLPYPMLVLAQLLILLGYAWVIGRLISGAMRPKRTAARWWLGIGALYFFSMFLRLMVGQMGLSSHRWFHSTLPCIFHLVLASFLLVVGAFHFREHSRV